MFIDKFTSILLNLNKSHPKTLITGDTNIDLLKLKNNKLSIVFCHITSFGLFAMSTQILTYNSLIDNIFTNNLSDS